MLRLQLRLSFRASIAFIAMLMMGCSQTNPSPAPTSGQNSFNVGGGGLPFVNGTITFDCVTDTVSVNVTPPPQIVASTFRHAVQRSAAACPAPAGSAPNSKCQAMTYTVTLHYRFLSDANRRDQGEHSIEADTIECPCLCNSPASPPAPTVCPQGQERDANGRCGNPCDNDFVPPREGTRWFCP